MALQPSLLSPAGKAGAERRFLSLHLPDWPTDYLKRADPDIVPPLALYERIKGGLRLAAVDSAAAALGLRVGQSVADARALAPRLTMKELDKPLLESAFADLADWHSNASPMVAVLTDRAPYGDLLLDITGVPHLFGGEAAMLRQLLGRLRALGYSVTGAIAPTIGAAWAASHFAGSRIVTAEAMAGLLDSLPIAALRLDEARIATLTQMGLETIGQLRQRPRKPLQARFGAGLLLRLDQAYGEIAERMTPRLPLVDHYVETRFAEPISQLDDVLTCARDLAQDLCAHLETHGLGAQTFHLFLYRVDHKVMTLSLNAARVTRDPRHIASLFHHRAQRLEEENYDPGFGIDLVRLAASSLDRLDAGQIGAFETETGARDIAQLADRLASRLGLLSVLRSERVASHIPERAVRLVPALAYRDPGVPVDRDRNRPLRLLPQPELVAISAEVPDGLPAMMIWRRQHYRLVRAAGPERISAEWWRQQERLALVPQAEAGSADPDAAQKPQPYIPDLPLFDPVTGMRDYYSVEDGEGHRFWVFRLGLYGGPIHPSWYLHGFFA